MFSPGAPHSEVRAAVTACGGGFLMTALFSFFVNLLMLSAPLHMLLIYDRVLTSGSFNTLIALSLLVAGLMVIQGMLEFVRSRVLTRIGGQIDKRLNARVFDAMMARALTSGRRESDRPLRDLNALREFLAGQGPLALFDAPWVPVYLAVVYLLHPLLGVVATLGALLLFAIALGNELLTRGPLGAAAQGLAEETALTTAIQRNAEAVATMNLLPGLRRLWFATHGQALAEQRTASDRAGSLLAMSKTVRLILQSAILGVGAALAIQQLISPGAMIAASIIMGRALAPVELAIGSWRPFVAARDAYGRLKSLLEAEPAEATRVRLPAAQGRLRVERLVAAPPGLRVPVLKDVSFDLAPGEALGIIGPSASGKSTLARLLVGLWRPQHGQVRLDGASLDQWQPAALGQSVGYLPQGVELFAGTVKDNIARFSDKMDDEAVVQAALQAGVHQVILNLPEGYNTQIGEAGGTLSGGQRQRIALARALYGAPALVVLDEPNANLDSEGDQALTRAIRDMKARGQTVVVIAHRPSAVAAVDKLMMLEQGRIRAFGPKDQVLAATTLQINQAGDKVASLNARQAS